MIARRGFLAGILAAGSAPAIVRASGLMTIVSPKIIVPPLFDFHAFQKILVDTEVQRAISGIDSVIYASMLETGWIERGHLALK